MGARYRTQKKKRRSRPKKGIWSKGPNAIAEAWIRVSIKKTPGPGVGLDEGFDHGEMGAGVGVEEDFDDGLDEE